MLIGEAANTIVSLFVDRAKDLPLSKRTHLRIDRNFCSVHEEVTSIWLYTPCNQRSGLRQGVYNLIEVISNEPKK